MGTKASFILAAVSSLWLAAESARTAAIILTTPPYVEDRK